MQYTIDLALFKVSMWSHHTTNPGKTQPSCMGCKVSR